MQYLIPSFIAGLLTILAPCILALLPVILGGTLTNRNPWKPLTVGVSLAVSVFLFSLLLKGTTYFISIPFSFWQILSGGLIAFFGVITIFPSFWEKIAFSLKLHKSETLIAKAGQKEGLAGAVLLGAAMGPVFTTCSPTYLFILATLLPASFIDGVINLLVYSFGLLLMVLAIGYGGHAVVARFRFAANPKGWFKKILGILLIFTGIAIMTGFDKVLENAILDAGYLGPIQIEETMMKAAR